MPQNSIPDEFRAALAKSTEPWFPGLSGQLTKVAWERHSRRGFDAETYGTHRWLRNDSKAPRICLDTLELASSLVCQIEVLPESSRVRYENSGLNFCSPDTIRRDLPTLQSATELIAEIASLSATIALYLRALHVLRAPGTSYDVSHSDPELPFSIFASVPSSTQDARLRLAESIVHECMHLQLTMIESALPLIADHSAQAYSPWQRTMRPLAGVLHGLYVFAVIFCFLEDLSRRDILLPTERTKISKRQSEIIQEINEVVYLRAVPELTPDGYNLTQYLFNCFAR